MTLSWSLTLAEPQLPQKQRRNKKNISSASWELHGSWEIMCQEVLCKLKITNQISETTAVAILLIFFSLAALPDFPSLECLS